MRKKVKKGFLPYFDDKKGFQVQTEEKRFLLAKKKKVKKGLKGFPGRPAYYLLL